MNDEKSESPKTTESESPSQSSSTQQPSSEEEPADVMILVCRPFMEDGNIIGFEAPPAVAVRGVKESDVTKVMMELAQTKSIKAVVGAYLLAVRVMALAKIQVVEHVELDMVG